jgi:hypothetical protein
VGKVIAIGPGGRPQAPERSDLFRVVIDWIRTAGQLDVPYVSPRCRNQDHADEVRRGIYRSARYYCSCGDQMCTRRHGNLAGCPDGGQRISCQADVVTRRGDDGRRHYHVQVTLFDKREAMRAVVDRYGPDPSKWPYQARARKLTAQ